MAIWDNILNHNYIKAPAHHPIAREVARLSEKAGIETPPNVYLLRTDLADSPATRMFEYLVAVLPKGKDMVVGSKAMDMLGTNSEEMSAVLAHELGHIKHYDMASFGTKKLSLASPLLGMAIAITSLAYYEHYKKRG